MNQSLTKDKVLIRIDMVNGVPRIRTVTGKELQRFLKTHPNANKIPTVSLSELEKATSMMEAVEPSPASPTGK